MEVLDFRKPTLSSPRSKEQTPIDRLISFCHKRSYLTKSDIVYPGDPADTFYIVLDGSVTVLIEDEDGKEIILSYLNKGDFIGEVGLFMGEGKREALVRAKTACTLAEISYRRFHQLMDADLAKDAISIYRSLGFQLSHRLLQTSRKVGRLAFLDVAGRVARTLLDLCQEPDAMTHPDGMQIKITRQEIGRIVGCSREMAGRVLKELQSQGLVSVAGKTIVVFGTR